jgi:hypothetical protein
LISHGTFTESGSGNLLILLSLEVAGFRQGRLTGGQRTQPEQRPVLGDTDRTG